MCTSLLGAEVLHALSGGPVEWRHGRIHPLSEFGGYCPACPLGRRSGLEAWEDPTPLRFWRILSCMPSREAQWAGGMGGSNPSTNLEDPTIPKAAVALALGVSTRIWSEHAYGASTPMVWLATRCTNWLKTEIRGTPRNSAELPRNSRGTLWNVFLMQSKNATRYIIFITELPRNSRTTKKRNSAELRGTPAELFV